MNNKSTSINKLITRKSLISMLKENGISRVNKDALDEIDSMIQKDTLSLSRKLSQLLLIKGKKTLTKEDIVSLSNSKDYPEI